jgi:DNA modification methylase
MQNPIKWNSEKRMIKELIPAKYNPRQASEKEAQDLASSLDKFSLAAPIIINRNNTVIGGHFRLRLLEQRGAQDVDVRVPDRLLNESEERELNLRLNKNTGSWDIDALADFDESLLRSVGFTNDELDRIIQSINRPEDDDIPENPPSIAKFGDVWQLGNHRIVCGDSTKRESVENLMDGKTARMIFTSPPYNMNSGMYETYKDNLASEEYIDFNLKVLNMYKNFLRGFVFWNISYNKNARWEFIEIMYRIIKETGLGFLELIVWDKGHALPITSKEGLTRQYEDILLLADEESIEKDLELYFCGKNDKKAWFNKKTQKGITNYWRISTNNSQLSNHLACFPVALPIKAITLMTEREDRVIDPFLGSGSTLIACEKTNRVCYGMEYDPKYIDVIIKRWEDYTGKKAECITAGKD